MRTLARTLISLNLGLALIACTPGHNSGNTSPTKGFFSLGLTADSEVKPLLPAEGGVTELKRIEESETPRLVLPELQEFISQRFPELIRPAADRRAGGTTKGIGPRIEVLKSETLRGIDIKTSLVLYQNGLATQTRAMERVTDLAQGVFCQTEGSEKIRDGQILELMKHEYKEADNDKHVRISRLTYQPAQSTENFVLVCTSRGEVPMYEFESNFKEVLGFSDNLGTFKPPGDQGTDTSDPHEEDRRRQSFKILDLEKLSKTMVANVREDALVLVSGELMKTSEAQLKVLEGQAEEACHVSRVIGKLQKDKIYRLDDTTVISADHQVQLAVLSYEYKADDSNSVNFFCFIRMNTKASEIFNVFKGVLEFGIEKNP